MLTLKFQGGGVEQSLDAMVNSLSELRPVFAKFARYMRQEVDQVFESQGGGSWPQRSEATQKRFDASKAARLQRIEATKYQSLVGSVRSSKRKAERRLAKTSQSNSKVLARRQRSVEKHQAQLEELARLTAGGARSTDKTYKKFNERVERRDQKADKKRKAVEQGDLLAQIANSIVIEFGKDSFAVASRIPWAGIHNEGGNAGNGASIPARTFLQWTPERIAKFVELYQDFMTSRFAKGSAEAQ